MESGHACYQDDSHSWWLLSSERDLSTQNAVCNSNGFPRMEIDHCNGQVLPPKDHDATKICRVIIQDNRGLGLASQALFGCSPDVVCDHVTVEQNVILKDKSTWLHSFARRDPDQSLPSCHTLPRPRMSQLTQFLVSDAQSCHHVTGSSFLASLTSAF
jgi:hypothetical protein